MFEFTNLLIRENPIFSRNSCQKSLGINFCNLHATQAMLYILTLLTTVSSDIEVHGDEKFPTIIA